MQQPKKNYGKIIPYYTTLWHIILTPLSSTTSERLEVTAVKLTETTGKLIETDKLHKEKTFIVQKQKDTEAMLTAQAKEVWCCMDRFTRVLGLWACISVTRYTYC